MLEAYGLTDNGPHPINAAEGQTVPEGARWIDLKQPTREEDRTAEKFLGAQPADAGRRRRRSSSPAASTIEDGAVFMTATVLTGVDLGKPALVAADHRRRRRRPHRHAPLRRPSRAMRQFLARAGKPGSGCTIVRRQCSSA